MENEGAVGEEGLYGKYAVIRLDGKLESPNARYFVLNYGEDWAAYQALKTYAEFIRATNPTLANDLEQARREVEQENFL